jgi:hypothetical protein
VNTSHIVYSARRPERQQQERDHKHDRARYVDELAARVGLPRTIVAALAIGMKVPADDDGQSA